MFALACLLAQTGCGNKPVNPVPKAVKPTPVLRFACPGEPASTIVKRYGQQWKLQSGSQIEIVSYQPDQDPPEADAWIIRPAELPHWAAASKLHAVPSTYMARESPYRWTNILGLYRQQFLNWDGKSYALPILGESYLLCYRADWLQDPAHKAAFKQRTGRDLMPPASWEDYTEIAAFFHETPRPGGKSPVPSLPALPTSDDELDREFYSVAAPFARKAGKEASTGQVAGAELLSFHYDLEQGTVRIDSPGFVHALQLMQRWQPFRGPEDAFLKGQAVFALVSAYALPRFQHEPGLRGKSGIAHVPASRQVFDYRTGQPQTPIGGNFVPYLGAAGLVGVVPTTNQEPDAAFAFLAYLSDPQTSRDLVVDPEWGGGITRRDHVEGRLGWQAFELDPNRTEQLVDIVRVTALHNQIVNPATRLRIPDQRDYQKALLKEVRAALLQGKEARRALTDAAEAWRALDAKKDPKIRLRDYRLNLGLD